MAHSNEGTARFIQAIREQAELINYVRTQNNVLGTITATGVYVDSIEDEIPRGDFLILQTQTLEQLQVGDRVLCIPVGDYYVVAGKVE